MRSRPVISNRRGTQNKSGRSSPDRRRHVVHSFLNPMMLLVGIGFGFLMYTYKTMVLFAVDTSNDVTVQKNPVSNLPKYNYNHDSDPDIRTNPKTGVRVDETHSSLDTSLHRTDAAVNAVSTSKKSDNDHIDTKISAANANEEELGDKNNKNKSQRESSKNMKENSSLKENGTTHPKTSKNMDKNLAPNKSENGSKEVHGSVANKKSSGELDGESAGLSHITEVQLMRGLEILSQQSVSTTTTPHVMKTKHLPDHDRKRILVTGGAGFVGSHLVDKLMMEGHEVIALDNFFTGQRKNVEHWKFHPNFSLIVHDVTQEIFLEVDQVYHLACPASPPHYQYNPIKTIKTSTEGTLHMLGLAKRVDARILLTSTSEVYGDPDVHPQPESYWGNVNTIGPRSCYDEGKRVAETMMYAYRNQVGVDVRVARIFNTFGPRMHPNDGRVVSNFIIQALQGKDLTIYGTGEQSRSFQYVDDLVNGLYALMNGDYDMPVNLGNPDEYTVKRFAEHIREITNSDSKISYLPPTQDDPKQRRPDISTAKAMINWEPRVSVDEGKTR